MIGSTDWELFEPYCGSGALTLHLLGASRAIVPYQGSKWRLRKTLERVVRDLGFEGRPSRIRITDPGPWSTTLPVVLSAAERAALGRRLEEFAEQDPGELYDEFKGLPVPANRVEFAAQHLFLQRLAFSGKAVGCRDGRWKPPGFNRTSAYGVEATERFGEIRPMIPSLARMIRDLEIGEAEVVAEKSCARIPEVLDRPTLGYLDPPYPESTDYPDGSCSEDEIRGMARGLAEAGAVVVISCGRRPVQIPGWREERIDEGRRDESPFRGKQPEWITIGPPEKVTQIASAR